MKTKKFHELDPEYQAILELADYIERLPGNEYNVKKHMLEILGLEYVPKKSLNHSTDEK